MNANRWWGSALAALVALAALAAARADDKPTDEGKAADFKGKAYDVKAKGKTAIVLDFASSKEATVTIKSEKDTDINLYIYDADKKVVAKDESPGPDCKIAFTPKASGKYTLEIVNLGTVDNKSTLKVEYAKSKDK
jgi:hypothetical protein